MIKNNKTALIIAGAVILVVIIASLFLAGGNKKLAEGINAVPPDAIAIFETEDLLLIFEKLKEEDKFYKQALATSMLGDVFQNINYIDSLCKADDDAEDFINSSQIIISVHATSNRKVAPLFITGMQNKKTEKKIFSWLKKTIKNGNGTLSKTKYSGADIYKVIFTDSINSICFSSYDGYFLTSFSEILIEKSVRQINAGKSIAGNKAFSQIYKTSRSRADGHFFLNYKNLTSALNSKLSTQGRKTLKYFDTFASWSAFDFNIRNKKIHLTGFTSTHGNYLSIFEGMPGQDDDILDFMPTRTSSFTVLGFTSGTELKKKYSNYLFVNKIAQEHNRNIKSFYKKYAIKESKNDFYRFCTNSASIFYEDVNKNGAAQRTYALLETSDTGKARRFFKIMIENYLKNNVDKKSQNYFQKTTVDNEDYRIYKLPEKKLMQLFFGKAFSQLDGEYITFYDDYILFANSPKAIKTYLENIGNGKVFSKRHDYKDLIYSLSSESNVLFYADMTHFKSEIKKLLSRRRAARYSADSEFLRNVKGPFLQYSSTTIPTYTSLQFLYQEAEETTAETIWELPGKSPFLSKPYIVINHNTKNKDVFVQDAKNRIYLISSDGAILWERQLAEKIMGKVVQVDAYKNNKLQLFFSTATALHCYDRKGNYLTGYPKKLASPATTPVLVLDYDHNKNYRFIIATKDKKVNLYNIKGELIEGWKFEKTKEEAYGEIQYFRNEGKDYIVFHDNENTYITDRQGNIRVKPEFKFPLAKNAKFFFQRKIGKQRARFVTTNTSGIVHYIYLSGKTSKNEIKKCTPNHYFLFEDIDGDGKKDYIFAENNKIEAFTKKDARKFLLEFESNISEQPTYYNFSKSDKRIGIVTAANNKIYLINGRGKVSQNFPLNGTSSFSIGQLKKTDKFGLIVGSIDKYLYKYNL